MEQVGRVDRPTALIVDEEAPRVPQRAAFFTRAAKGDLGEKSRRERARFAFKHPLSFSQLQLPDKQPGRLRHFMTSHDTPRGLLAGAGGGKGGRGR